MVVALRAAHLGQEVGQGQAVLLAGNALPARLDAEEPGDPGGHRHHVDGVVEDDEARRAEAAADPGQSLVADRGVEERAGDDGVGDTGHHRFDAPPDPGPPTDGLDHLTQPPFLAAVAAVLVGMVASHEPRIALAQLMPVGVLAETENRECAALGLAEPRRRSALADPAEST